VDLLTTVLSLNSRLRVVLKEQQDTALQIITKTQELQQRLDNYSKLMVAQEVEHHERATGQERENIE
jgi:DNA-binding protein H-NS